MARRSGLWVQSWLFWGITGVVVATAGPACNRALPQKTTPGDASAPPDAPAEVASPAAGQDANTAQDASMTLDAYSAPDAGPAADVSPTNDAGATNDASPIPDTGPPPACPAAASQHLACGCGCCGGSTPGAAT